MASRYPEREGASLFPPFPILRVSSVDANEPDIRESCYDVLEGSMGGKDILRDGERSSEDVTKSRSNNGQIKARQGNERHICAR